MAAIKRKVEITQKVFLWKTMGKQVRRKEDKKWEKPKAEVVREAAGTQSAMIYIGRRQGTVAQWVALRPIFEVCTGEKSYKGLGLRRDT